MNSTQAVLLEAIKASLFDYSPNYPDDVNWAEVVEEAKAQAVMGIISSVIPINDEITKQGIRNYIRILYEQDKLIKLLDENNIPCVILKGCAAAVYYPKPHLRAMGDVDFLVSHDNFFDTVKVMEENNYQYICGKDKNGELPKTQRHLEYTKNGVSFELHHHFSSAGFDIDDILEEAIKKRSYHEMNGYRIPMLPDAENGLVLLGHINHHLKNSNLGLRQIIDWEMFFYEIMNNENWHKEFGILAENAGLKTLAVSVTKMCEKYLGLMHFVEFDDKEADDYTDKLIDVILSDGNFGAKSTLFSANERKLKDSVYEVKTEGFFCHFQKIGLMTWSLCYKYPVLKPFAWIYGIWRHTVRGVKPFFKSKNIKKYINEVSERENLFQKIGVRKK